MDLAFRLGMNAKTDIMSVCDFNLLPDVVLLSVFKFLRFGDLCRIGGVCQRWYHLSRSPALWKMVDAQDVRLNTHQLGKLVSRLTSTVKYLHVCGETLQNIPFLTHTNMIEIKARCPALDTFIIESAFVTIHITWTDVTVEDLPPGLTTFSLRKSYFHADQFFCSASHPSAPQICCLDVSHCWCISDHDIPFFARLPYLKELYLENCDYISNVGLEILVTRTPYLRVLDIDDTNVTDVGFQNIAERCKMLEKLFLGRTWTTDTAMLSLSEDSLPHLTALCLKRTALSDVGLQLTCMYLRRLQWLNVNGTKVTLQGIREASVALPNLIMVSAYDSHSWVGVDDRCEHFMSRHRETAACKFQYKNLLRKS